MLFRILQQVNWKSNIDPHLVEDICLGNVSCHLQLLYWL
jgi:hypothetical protein